MKKRVFVFFALTLCFMLYMPNSPTLWVAPLSTIFLSTRHTPQQVELFSAGDETVDISNWYIDNSGGTTYFTVPSGSTLAPQTLAATSSNQTVLGASTQKNDSSLIVYKLPKTISFLSAAYSLLTICSVFFRMKLNA